MSEKKRSRRKKDEYTGPGEQQVEKPSKEEYKIAKWMKKNVRTKKTKFLNHVVEYFSACKAIDALLNSKFAEGDTPIFTTREQVVEYLDIMLEHKFFHRAKKVPVCIDELRGGSCKDGAACTAVAAAPSTPKPSKNKDEKLSKKEKDKEHHKDNTTAVTEGDNKEKATTDKNAENTDNNGGGGGAGAGDDANKEKKEKRKRKIRLDMHPDQVFVDGAEAYVWIYDPIPLHYWIYGLLLLLGAIGICLFPLWPPLLRKGVYYLSIAAAGFLVFILALTVLRLIIFTIVWAITTGKLHLWIFPNLTEDVGFFASFWPLFETTWLNDKNKKSSDKQRSKSKSKKHKEKDSDAEDDNNSAETIPLIPEKIEDIKEHDVIVDEEHEAACKTRDEDSNSSGPDTDEQNESSDNKYSDDSDLSGYCILETSDSPNAEIVERKSAKTKKEN